MLIVSILGNSVKGGNNLFPMESHLIDRGQKAAVILLVAPVLIKLPFRKII